MTEKLCENKDFCYVFMPPEGIKMKNLIKYHSSIMQFLNV